jgi:DNA-binding transcriptional regulator LsrR (DeoR family)
MSGMKPVDLYARVRYACHVEGLSQRETARRFGIDTKTVRKMLTFAVPPGYRRLTTHHFSRLPREVAEG